MTQECQHLWIAAVGERPLLPGYQIWYCVGGCKVRREVAEELTEDFILGVSFGRPADLPPSAS